eukprot:m.367682 g.367682  ORF g.367682 m.367682 type:complete len:57 (+) comp20836_c0_seq12:1-171(+)
MLESEDVDTFTQCAIDEDREETMLIDYGVGFSLSSLDMLVAAPLCSDTFIQKRECA